MSDVLELHTLAELRDDKRNLKAVLDDYKQTETVFQERQEALHQEQKVLNQSQGTLDQQQIALNRRQKELSAARTQFAKERTPYAESHQRIDRLIQEKLGHKQGENPAVKKQQKQKPQQGIVTQKEIDKLLRSVTSNKHELGIKPPRGTAPGLATTIDRDLKIMTAVEAKQNRLNGSSEKLQHDFKKSTGRKR